MFLAALYLSIVPVFICLFYIYIRDKYEREPFLYVLLVFFLGILSLIPTGIFEQIGTMLFWGKDPNVNQLFEQGSNLPLPKLFSYTFLSIGLIEEGFKLFPVIFFAWASRHFNEKFDGIVYCVASSLGFASLENIMYVLPSQHWFFTGVARSFTAIPAHTIFAIFMGYYLGLARFEKSTPKKILLLLSALFIPAVIHSIYDFLLMSQSNLVVTLVYFTLIFIIALKKVTDLSHQSNPVPDSYQYTFTYAGFFRRLAAFIVDSAVILSLVISLTQFVTIKYYNESIYESKDVVLEIYLAASLYIFSWIYYTILESSKLQGTIGKWIFNLIVTDQNDRRISYLAANIRFLVKTFSILFLMSGYVFMGFTQHSQTLHDLASSTLVFRKKTKEIENKVPGIQSNLSQSL